MFAFLLEAVLSLHVRKPSVIIPLSSIPANPALSPHLGGSLTRKCAHALRDGDIDRRCETDWDIIGAAIRAIRSDGTVHCLLSSRIQYISLYKQHICALHRSPSPFPCPIGGFTWYIVFRTLINAIPYHIIPPLSPPTKFKSIPSPLYLHTDRIQPGLLDKPRN
jgi:hypothetical protein